MSVSPAQNFSKPPPVPDWPTVIFTSGFSSLNSSAAAWANGKTVEEPSIAIVPRQSPSAEDRCRRRWRSSSSSPHAATPKAERAASTAISESMSSHGDEACSARPPACYEPVAAL